MAEAPKEVTEVHRSSRDPNALRDTLQAWLATQLPAGANPSISELTGTSATGMSSETLLFDATWTEGGEATTRSLVARLAPDPVDVPVFPTYAMQKQFDIIGYVGEHSEVPVPKVLWCEPTGEALGAAAFVMEKVDGVVPPDVMPYVFGGNWLYDASPEDQRRLQDSVVDVLAGLHALDTTDLGFLEYDEAGDTPLRRHVANRRSWYEYATGGKYTSPLIDRGFAWLDAHWPAEESPVVLAWGDSRIGNMLFRDFEPVAVLDWEMVGLGPRELDLGWLVYMHAVFQGFGERAGLAGMPDYLQRADVVKRYEEITGYTPRDMDFFETYAALQMGIVGLITGRRMVHFGEREMPDDIDDLLMNRPQLEQLLDATS